jgi:Spy/CpxP family protein refolding chaperone
MKILTKISLLAVGLAAVSVPAFSATADDTAPKPGKRAHLHAKFEHRAKLRAHAAKRLELTDAQKEQLKAKRAETKSALKALKDDASLSKEQKRAKAHELLAGARSNFRSALTADQQAKLDGVREKMAKHRKHRRGR